jgi:putative glutamine amidotransferase
MAGRPRVGVTGDGRRWAPSWWCLAAALRLAGAVPERLSVRHKASGTALDALIISGGNDIGPDLYGGDTSPKTRVDAERDALEIRWIEYACERDLPLLGICRGAQLINVVLGGNLHQDVRPLRKKTYNRPGLLPTKQVFVEPNSRIGRYLKRRKLRVNSLHHQAINKPGEGLAVVGRDLDGLCQAIECRQGRAIIGVQWHPEYLAYLPKQFALFRWLIRRTPQ